MLLAQSSYGKIRVNADDGPISMGRYLFPTVPEDKFDRALPQERGLLLASDVRIDNRAELSADLGMHPSTISLLLDRPSCSGLSSKVGRRSRGSIFVGEFAFAFWDSARERLLLARADTTALVHSISIEAGTLCIDAKRAARFVRDPLRSELSDQPSSLRCCLKSVRDTYFREIERVEPGHLVSVERSGVNSRHSGDRRSRCTAVAQLSVKRACGMSLAKP